MSTTLQNATDYVSNQVDLGNVTTAEANVMIVQMMGFRVVYKLPRDVRKALNAAVKAGELGRLKKDGLKPEIYHHKNARTKALEEQERHFKAGIEALKGIFVHSKDL